MNRRRLLKLGGGLGVLAGTATAGRYALLAPPVSDQLASVDELSVALFESLSHAARAAACIAYDHPLRQYFNRGVWGGGLTVHAASMDWASRCILTDLYHASLSEVGRGRVPQQLGTNWPGVNYMKLLICGDPRSGPYQIILTTGHLNLRIGGRSREGAAFGGPQVYGDQRGNGRVGLPNNTYRYQLESAHRIFSAMTAAERQAARVEMAPAQTIIEVQGAAGRFDGIPVGDLSAQNRRLARELVGGILDTYADAEYAWACLQRNGGIDALHIADYDIDFQGGRRAGDGPSQIFRLEGPAAVMYFRGEPHLHAFLNIAMDGERPLSLGEDLGHNPAVLAGEDLRRYFHTAMQSQSEADIAWYPPYSVVGRLRAGPLRSGDLWVAESWIDKLAVVEVRGGDLAPPLVDELRARGRSPQSGSTYRVATTGYVANFEARSKIGKPRSRRTRGLLRDALVSHAREHGFVPVV